MAKQVMPEAELPRTPSDIPLPEPLFSRISLFAQMKSPPSLDRFPGSVVLRRYRKGETICQHGDAGWSAFYILGKQDLLELRDYPRRRLNDIPGEMAKCDEALAKACADKAAPEAQLAGNVDEACRKKIAACRRDIDKHQAALASLRNEADRWPAIAARMEMEIEVHDPATADDEPGIVATARLPSSRNLGDGPPGWLARLGSWFRSGKTTVASRPSHIPNDGPRDFDFASRGASLFEGDLFGEMSCIYRTPRSATVVAARDCYMLELLRNILDVVQKDAGHKQRMDALLKTRLVETFLRDLPVFGVLGAEHLQLVLQRSTLIDFEPGTLIFDEHDRSDCLYLIGSGIVRIMNDVSPLFALDDVALWPELHHELVQAGRQTDTVAHYLWQQLPAQLRRTLEDSHPAQQSPALKTEILEALNAVVKDHNLQRTPALRKLILSRGLTREVWEMVADARHADLPELCRCNRQILESICGGEVRAATAGAPEMAPDEIVDWKAFAARLVAASTRETEPAAVLWDLFDGATQDVLRSAATSGLAPDARREVVADIQRILTSQVLLLFEPISRLVDRTPALAKKVMGFLPRGQRWTPWMFHRYSRTLHRLLLEAVLPRGLGGGRARNPAPRVVAYRSRGEFIGGIGLLENTVRSATCVAYNHPDNDPEREVGPVQLVRFDKALLEELLHVSANFRNKVAEMVAARKAETRSEREAPADTGPALLRSERATQLGLVDGQKLMLIDLDRCTRCDECVQACVATHADRRSRLFLEGPRFDRYLVPTTCRSCLDPVCMIGCPVGSIHRGDTGQIIIEDWCIGCEQCAKQCPYGAIQMHDTGILPEGSHGWRFMLAANLGDLRWTQRKYADERWHTGRAPFRFDRDLQARLSIDARSDQKQSLCFRGEFHVEGGVFAQSSGFAVELTSLDEAARVWINGQELCTTDKARRGKRSFAIAESAGIVTPGRNVVAVQASAAPGNGDVLFDLRLDDVRKPALPRWGGEVIEKPVTQLAVVCDLCSHLPNGPACVHACPHDAALRIDGRSGIPWR